MHYKLYVHCDGSCMQSIGGIGIVICTPSTETLLCKGAFENTTNNRMELLAFIYAVYYLEEFIKTSDNNKISIEIYADSKYLVDGYNIWINSWVRNNWRTSSSQEVLNMDLWQKIQEIKMRFNYPLYWEKAHEDNLWNNKADLLAKIAVGNNSFALIHQISPAETLLE